MWMLIGASMAAAEPAKLALVVGNGNYGSGQSLPNAVNDAHLMSVTLRKLGFTVAERNNLSREQFIAAVDGFAAGLPAGATAFFYYAGHGMQIDDNNYLTPVDMKLTSSDAAKLSSFALAKLMDRLKNAKSAVNIVVLDACRNNPFQPDPPTRYRGFGNMGLSQTNAPRGTLIAYSTSPGQVAPDGKGKHSPYTEQLAKTLAEPATELVTIFRKVGNEVRRQTHDEQTPWLNFTLAGDYYFAPQDQARYGTNGSGPAQPGVNIRIQPSRTLLTDKDVLQPWYRSISAVESTQLDWEIRQRVRNATPDELSLLQHQAAGGSVVAQTVLGLVYREGIAPLRVAGTQHVMRYQANNGEARKWLKKAAKAGFPIAQVELGEMYYYGRGIEANVAESRYWIQQAARTGYTRAKLDLIQLQGMASPGDVDFKDVANALMESIREGAGSKPPRSPALR
jgi:hypothetical protein